MEKLSPREAKSVQRLTVNKWMTQGLNPGSVIPEPTLKAAQQHVLIGQTWVDNSLIYFENEFKR